jgi:hypothetical protein
VKAKSEILSVIAWILSLAMIVTMFVGVFEVDFMRIIFTVIVMLIAIASSGELKKTEE